MSTLGLFKKLKYTNYINEDLEIISKDELFPIYNKDFSNFGYFGEIYGMVYKGNPISKEETIKLLSHTETSKDLIEIVRFIVGPCWIIGKNNKILFIFLSSSAPSIFLYKQKNRLIFSKIEADICSYAINNEDLNPYQLYDMLFAHRFDSIPYGALFNGVLRIPENHFVSIDKNLNINYESILNLKTESSLIANYNSFKRTLEGIAKLYVDTEKKIFVLFSCGIDSSVVLYALKKFSDSVTPISTSQAFEGNYDGALMRERIHLYKKIFNIDIELLYANRYSKEQRKIRDDFCRLFPANNARWDSYVYYCVMEAYKNQNDALFITGQEMDDGYGIAFTKYHRNKGVRHRFMIGRYFYTKFYQQNLNFILNRWMRKKFFRKSNIKIDPKIEYLTVMLYMREYQDDYLPYIKNLSKYPKDFLKEYEKYKEKFFLKCAFKNKQEINNLSFSEINRKFRILRHYYSVPNVLNNMEVMYEYQNPHMINLPTEGPMVDFFCNLQLGWRDIFKGKRFLYKYFKECTGKHFLKIFNQQNFMLFHKKAIKEIKGNRLWITQATPNKFVSAEVYQEDYRNNIDLHNPQVLKFLTHSYMRKNVRQLYNNAINGLLEYNTLQNIYNLELFLQNIEQLLKMRK